MDAFFVIFHIFISMSTTEKLKELLGIAIPIIQAPVGSTVTPSLVAAVSKAGGLGGIPLTWSTIEETQSFINEVRNKTSKPFYANFVLNFEPKTLQTALDLGVKIIQFSWGLPDSKMIKAIKSVNGIMGIQVANAKGAKQAIDLGADYLICQGIEAGGHVQSSRNLKQILQEVLHISNHVPVLASGGIADAITMKTFMDLGAAGVVMGSRFVATQENGAHDLYKQNLVNANLEDTIYTICMNKGWDAAAHRVLRNKSIEMWEAMGCSPVGERPGEFDKVANRENDEGVERYHSDAPLQGMTGDVKEMANYAGYSVTNIHDIPSVQDLIYRIWNEFKALQ